MGPGSIEFVGVGAVGEDIETEAEVGEADDDSDSDAFAELVVVKLMELVVVKLDVA